MTLALIGYNMQESVTVDTEIQSCYFFIIPDTVRETPLLYYIQISVL